MRTRSIVVATFLGFLPGMAVAQSTCFEGRDVCVSACTPGRVAVSYFGSYRRCTASCKPRLDMCLRTGVWVDLESYSTGGPIAVAPF